MTEAEAREIRERRTAALSGDIVNGICQIIATVDDRISDLTTLLLRARVEKQRLLARAGKFLGSTDHREEWTATLDHFYWQHSDLSVPQIAKAFGIGVAHVCSKVWPLPVPFECVVCKEAWERWVGSRQERTEVERAVAGKGWGPKGLTCPECAALTNAVAERENEDARMAAITDRFKADARQTELDIMSYEEYLGTEEWKQLAHRARRAAGFQCGLCNAKAPLHVHHRHYTKRGHERPSDLIGLCADCHSKFHDKLPAGE